MEIDPSWGDAENDSWQIAYECMAQYLLIKKEMALELIQKSKYKSTDFYKNTAFICNELLNRLKEMQQ